MEKFIFLEHTADVKFQAFGKNLEEVFINSALAMREVLHKGKIKGKKIVKIKVKGKDIESLLYNFLEEFLFLLDSKNFIFSEISDLKIDEKKFELKAEISGDDAKNYEFKMDIKAVTYHEMFVKKEKGKWVAQVVLDI
jgi:SHS2 domain-containing protein